MNTKDLRFEGVSKNLRYIFTNKGILQTGDFFKNKGNIIKYSPENIHVAVTMMKEHEEVFYKAGKKTLVEYANSSRKFLYKIMEIFELRNSSSIIKEWEERFGNKLLLLNESTDKLLVENRVNDSWNGIKLILEWTLNPFNKDFYTGSNWKEIGTGVAKGVKNAGEWFVDQGKAVVDWSKKQWDEIQEKGILVWMKDKVVNTFKAVRDAIVGAWKCLTSNFIECLMEGLRSAAFSAIGMGITTALMFVPPIGEIVDYVIFGSLLIWDIYKMLSGKYESGKYQWSWADIAIDAVCLILPALGGILKAALRGTKSAFGIGAKAAKSGGLVKKAISGVVTGISKIIGYMGKAARWFGEKLGIKFLTRFGGQAEKAMTKGAKEMGEGLAKGSGKEAAETGVKSGSKDAAETGVKSGSKDAAETGVKDSSKRYGFVFNKPVPYVLKKSGKTVIITAALCSALGLDGWTCHEKAENGEFTKQEEEEIIKILESDEYKQKMDSISLEDAETLGLI